MDEHKPVAVKWTPDSRTNLIFAVTVGVLGSVGAALALPVLTPAVIIGAAMIGISSALASFFGLKSAGTRKDS